MRCTSGRTWRSTRAAIWAGETVPAAAGATPPSEATCTAVEAPPSAPAAPCAGCVPGTFPPGVAKRYSALCAWASKPSARANVAATFARWSAPVADGSIKLLRFWKS